MKNTEETQPQILIQPTPMHCIQSVFEPYLITSGRYFGTTYTITRTNTTGCVASPTSTSSASPSVGQQICTIGSGCTPMFGSQLSKSHTGGQERGLVSKCAFWHSREWSMKLWCYLYVLGVNNMDLVYLETTEGDGCSIGSSLLLFKNVLD